MTQRTFEHVKTIHFGDPDFMPIFLQPCGPDHVIALQTWCAFLIDVGNQSARRVDYPAWAWNVSSSHEEEPALTIYFERKRQLNRCPLDIESGKIEEGDRIDENLTVPGPQPPHLVTDEAIWFARGGKGHTLVAARYDRMTDLITDISRITPTDFFLMGPDRSVFLHRWDVGLLRPHPVDQPELVVNYRKIGCSEPRGAAFDSTGTFWVLDERIPAVFKVDMSNGSAEIHDLSELHGGSADPKDPSPYPWHSCIWCGGFLVVGCCDSARVDILRPVEGRADSS